MRIIVADCSAEYSGRLNASLRLAKRVLLIKADNSLLIFSELGSYKPLNWMAAPCTIKDITPEHADDDVTTEVPQKVIRASADKSNDVLEVTLQHIYSDETYDLGEDPGPIKDGVEDHLQKYLAEQIERIGEGATTRQRYCKGYARIEKAEAVSVLQAVWRAIQKGKRNGKRKTHHDSA